MAAAGDDDDVDWISAQNDDDEEEATSSSHHEEIIAQENLEGYTVREESTTRRCRKRVLMEFRCRMEDAILGNYLLGKSNAIVINRRLHFPVGEEEEERRAKARDALREISLWGVPLLPSKGHEGTDVVLMKFLRANDFKVANAFEMLRKTLIRRKEFQNEKILNEDLGSDDHDDNEAVFFNSGTDRQGHPLCFYVYGAMNDRDRGFEERRERFLRLRVQSMERCIEKLNFRAGEANSVVQITDLKNLKKEIRRVSEKAVLLIQENYPELIHKNIIINVPFWYCTFHALVSPFMSQRTRSKFVFGRPKRVTETLLKFVAPENIPVQYGGLKRENEDEFSPADKVSELVVKGGATRTIQVPISKVGVTAVWDVAVVGSNVGYKEEFVPDDECSYTILLKKEKKVISKSVRNSFHIGEPGKIVITIKNGTFQKRRAFYRYKTKPTIPMYVLLKQL